MPIDIRMPALSPTMEHGNLIRWLKKEGDKVKPGDALVEIETDKATMEVEAGDEGVLAKIIVPDGTNDVAVNDVIGVIAGEGEEVESAAEQGAPRSGTGGPCAPLSPPQTPTRQETTPHPATGALAEIEREGAGAAIDGQQARRIFASPLARRIAKDSGLDLATIRGTGPHGRIIERDIKAALAGAAAAAPAPEARAPAPPRPPSDELIRKYFAPGSFEEVPHEAIRKTIARRLVEAKSTIPHIYLSADCELGALVALREAINDAAPKDKDGKPAYKISINDFFVKALALALMRVPEANVTWTKSAMLKHKHADVGVAVALPGGLITPIIRSAEAKSLSVISNEIKDLAARARARKLKPEEYEGGSSAVSNLGMYGVTSFSAIINPPQATILAVGAAGQRVVVKNGVPAPATMASMTLSCDHRAIDGVLGAELLAAIKELIQKPAGMLV